MPEISPSSDRNPRPDTRVQTICLITLTGLAVAAALYWLQPMMIPFVLAILLTYVISPVADGLARRLRVPNTVAIAAALLLGVLVLVLVGAMVASSMRQLADNAAAYQTKIARLVATSIHWLAAQGIDIAADAVETYLTELPVGAVLARVANGLVDTLSNTFLVLVFTVYLLLGRGTGPVPSEGIRGTIETRIKRYLAIKFALSAATGTLTGIILWALDVDLAMVFGVLAFVLNFIPNVGSIVATVLPLPVVIVSPDATTLTIVLALALPGTVQMFIGNVAEPKLLGESLELHPIAILLTLILWGMLWGVVGMILATPMTAVIKILLETSPLTRPMAALLEGRFVSERAFEPGPASSATD